MKKNYEGAESKEAKKKKSYSVYSVAKNNLARSHSFMTSAKTSKSLNFFPSIHKHTNIKF